MKQNALSQFCTDTEIARFTLRDKYLQMKLNADVLYVDREDSTEIIDMQTEKDGRLCPICYYSFSDWLDFPLSISSHDQLHEWLLFVPLPVRMFFEKAFLNARSLQLAQSSQELVRSKVPRLTSIYEACLNTFNKNYFGPTQQMNTAELIVNYHNATTVFNIAQSSGISMSLISAEKKLKEQANKERLYFRTYLKHHHLAYQALTDGSVLPHEVSLRDCHLIFLVDNLVRTQKKRDPDSGRMKSIQLNTLPITVKGLPRNSKITDSWHTNECDGSENCCCKDATEIPKKDIFNIFLSHSEEEFVQLELFRHEAVWGMNFLLQHHLIRPIIDAAAEKEPAARNDDDDFNDLTISFHNISLQEVGEIDEDIKELEKSVSAMSVEGESDKCQADLEHLEENVGETVSYDEADDLHDDDEELDNYFMGESDEEVSSTSSHSSFNFEAQEDVSNVDNITSTDLFKTESSKILNRDAENERQMYVNSPSGSLSETESNLNSQELVISNMDQMENESVSAIITSESNVSSFVKYEAPSLLCRHPPPAVGRDDDIRVLRNILTDVVIKSGHFLRSRPNKDRILLAPDHKIANNVFTLMKEPHFHCLLPEFPVLHLLK